MDIENFIWDKKNQSLSWSYNGNMIKKIFENMNFANYDLNNNYVLVKIGKEFKVEQVYYLSFEGKQIFAFDKINDKVEWKQKDRLVEVDCKDIVHANIYFEQDVILVISGESQNNRLLKGYGKDGKELFIKKPPQGYTFNYLSALKNQPAVVCNGGKENADQYGRSSWYFSIDFKTGDMSKENLAY